MKVGSHVLGGDRVFVVAELGANHSGDLATCLRMIDAAKDAGADAVKLQKRTPELCIPPEQQAAPKDTPWGVMSYLDYRRRLEFGLAEYAAIDERCRACDILWSASAWDVLSLDFLVQCAVPFVKIPSACLTDDDLLAAARASGIPTFLSTGMSTGYQISHAVLTFGSSSSLLLMHCTSTYPTAANELNLRCIQKLQERYGPTLVGYSGHHPGIWDGFAAAVMGACVIEKHFTLDRASWGTDQAASLEPAGFTRMVRYIRNWELARGDGVKRVYESELPIMAKLRRPQSGG